MNIWTRTASIAAVLTPVVLMSAPAFAEAPAPGVIEGTVWFDRDANGERGPGENVFGGAWLEIENLADHTKQRVQTYWGDGKYQLANLPPGKYTVRAPQEGYVSTTGATVDVEVTEGGTTTTDFGVRGGVVTGSAWNDVNEDGIRQPGEPPRSDVSFGLADRPAVPGFPRGAVTDADGNYRFDDVPAGRYVVIPFSVETDWTLTKPGADSDFDDRTRETPMIELAVGGQAGPFDAGYLHSEHDLAIAGIDLPELRVGQEAGIEIVLANHGNTPELTWGTVVLPAGLKPLSVSGFKAHIDGQTVQLGNYTEKEIAPGEQVTVVIRVLVEKPIRGAELSVEVHNGMRIENTPEDNSSSIAVNTVEAPAAAAAAVVPVAHQRELAATGAASPGLLGIGGALLTVGAAALWTARRKRA